MCLKGLVRDCALVQAGICSLSLQQPQKWSLLQEVGFAAPVPLESELPSAAIFNIQYIQ